MYDNTIVFRHRSVSGVQRKLGAVCLKLKRTCRNLRLVCTKEVCESRCKVDALKPSQRCRPELYKKKNYALEKKSN